MSHVYLKEQQEELLEEELEVNWITPQLPISEEKLDTFRKATAEDMEMQMLRNMTMNGRPLEKKQVPKEMEEYWTFEKVISYATK